MITEDNNNGHYHEIDAHLSYNQSCFIKTIVDIRQRLDGCINNIGNLAFALVGKPITQRLEYAHFLPLANNIKLHQVKVIVDYAPISLGKYAYMKVSGPNRALLKISSSPHGVGYYCSR